MNNGSRPSPDPRRVNQQGQRLSMRWWSIKVVCGSTLVAAVILQVIYGLSPSWPVPLALGQGLVIVGVLLVVYHYLLLKQRNNNIESPSQLVTQNGLYRLIRHPMYLADLVWMSGMFLIFTNPFSLLVLLLGALAVHKQAKHEDSFLRERFGDDYVAWQRRTKLLIPFI